MLITFDPIIHDKVWGTEEWILTEQNVPNNIPKHLWEDIQVEAWGRKNPDRSKFPLALKVIDAKENLSLQVHPDKNEVWYVLEAKEDAEIMIGFNAPVFTENGVVVPDDGIRHRIKSKAQHSIQLAKGTAHALGGGNKVFELADGLGTTYRIFDWGRKGREMQVKEAMACMDPHWLPELRPEAPWSAVVTKPMSTSDLLRAHRNHVGAIPFSIMPLKLCIEDVPSIYPRYPSKNPQLNVPQEHSKEGFVNEYATRLYVPNDSTFYYHYVLEGPIECEGQSFEKGQGFLVTASHRKGYVLKGKGSVLTVSFL